MRLAKEKRSRSQILNSFLCSSTASIAQSTDRRVAVVLKKRKKKKKEKCKLPRHAVLSMGCYILSWYNPHFWVFRSMKLQRVTMTTGINPRDAEECQQSWIYISREKTGRYAVLCCAPMSFWNSYTSSCAAQTKAYQIYIYVQVYLNWNQLHLA